MSHEEKRIPAAHRVLTVFAAAAGNGPRGLTALGAAALSTGLLTATTAPTAGGRDKSPGSHRGRWPDRLRTDPAWGGAVHLVWPTSMR